MSFMVESATMLEGYDILEVESRNSVLLMLMVELRLIGWNDMKSTIGRSLSYPLCHLKEALGDIFGSVNVIRI